MDKALQDVILRGIPIATQDNNVHKKKPLDDRVKGYVQDYAQMGGPAALQKHEEILCQYIEHMVGRGFLLTMHQIILCACCLDRTSKGNVFGENGPSYGWWLKFKVRYPKVVRLRRPDSVDRGRGIFSSVDLLKVFSVAQGFG